MMLVQEGWIIVTPFFPVITTILLIALGIFFVRESPVAREVAAGSAGP